MKRYDWDGDQLPREPAKREWPAIRNVGFGIAFLMVAAGLVVFGIVIGMALD